VEQRERIIKKVSQSFLFNCLEEKDLDTVIDAMEEVHKNEGETVIQQGENGDVLYLIEEGQLDCFKIFKKEEGEKYLKTYLSGEAFGELALLYNAPRAATIRAKCNSILWALDRETFNNIVKEAAIKKRDKYVNFLNNVEILKTMDKYELGLISDAVKIKKFNKDEVIIKQFDKGDEFFLILEGDAIATKFIENTMSEEEFVKDYKIGDYFGELALITNEPRAANVIAKSDCKCLALDRMSFKRLLGPLENLLKRNSEFYLKYIPKK